MIVRYQWETDGKIKWSYLGWASLVAQTVKRLPTMWETWVWSLGWEDSLEEGNSNPLQYSCLKNPMDWGARGLQSMESQRVGHDWATSLPVELATKAWVACRRITKDNLITWANKNRMRWLSAPTSLRGAVTSIRDLPVLHYASDRTQGKKEAGFCLPPTNILPDVGEI